jgi:processive 1,2-diacylglycerol beta-glucosyltransferase
MPELYLKSNNTHLGHISDDDLRFLIANLEEESLTDEDYTITRLTFEFLKDQGMTPGLQAMLEKALGDKEEVEIKYTQS